MNQASTDTTGSPTPETAVTPGAELPKAVATAQKTAQKTARKATQKTVRKTAVAKAEPEVAAAVPAKAVKPVKPAKTVKPAPAAKPAVAASPVAVKPAAVKKPSKAVKVVKPVPAVKPVLPVQESVTLKVKLVRDSFTMPELEYAQLDALKQRSLSLAHHAKKSEVLRAGITALAAMGDAELLAALQAVPPLKTGRPKSRKADKVNGEIKLKVTPKAVTKAAPKALAKPAGKTKLTARKG